MEKTLFIATGNSHKTSEIKNILCKNFSVVKDYSDLDYEYIVPEETGVTFYENSKIKSLAGSLLDESFFVLADDSGLEVDALDGKPGVYSSRYSGENSNDLLNKNKLIEDISNIKNLKPPYLAQFKCVITFAKNNFILSSFEGIVKGEIILDSRGNSGFGYDSIFIPEGYDKTFAELSISIKNKISHRADALLKAKIWIEENI